MSSSKVRVRSVGHLKDGSPAKRIVWETIAEAGEEGIAVIDLLIFLQTNFIIRENTALFHLKNLLQEQMVEMYD